MVQTDLPCIGCGYNLRGLGVDRVCPECGVEISRSLEGDRLDAADLKWLTKVMWGLRFLSHGLSCSAWSALLIFAVGIAAFVLAATVSLPDLQVMGTIVLVSLGIVFYGGLLAATIGVFVMTISEPRELLRESAFSSRRLARVAMIATLILILARGMAFSPNLNLSRVVATAIDLALVAVVTVAIAAILTYLSGFALRVPSSDLAKRTRNLARTWRWLLPTTALVVLVQPIAARFGASPGRSPLGLLMLPVSCALIVLPFIVLFQGIRTLSLLADYRGALGGCLIAARTRRNEIPSGNCDATSGDRPDWR